MGRRSTIENHPQRAEIEQAILDGETLRNIAARFDISTGSVVRHRDKHMSTSLVKVVAQKEIRDVSSGNFIAEQVQDTLEEVSKLLDACKRELEDPERPGEYTLAPNARDIMVVVERVRASDDKVVREKASLQTLVELVDRELPIDTVRIEPRGPDAVKAFLEALKVRNGPLQIILNAFERVKERADQTAVRQEIAGALFRILAEELENEPVIRQRLVNRIRRELGGQ